MATERALSFDCGGEVLTAIAHLPDRSTDTGVLIIVGGPQYRAGSHRQFVLLARHLADQGIPAFRFDHRGVGDASGESRSFLDLDDDIRSALDAFQALCEGLDKVHLLGLCDAATAAMLYANADSRVAGLILLNPWVRSEAGLAKTYLRTYYLRRLGDLRAWRDLLSHPDRIRASLGSLRANIAKVLRASVRSEQAGQTVPSPASDAERKQAAPFPERMLSALRSFRGPVLFILSGNDLTAEEFRQLVRGDRRWRKAVRSNSVTWIEHPEANHTFSTRRWRDRVAGDASAWVLGK